MHRGRRRLALRRLRRRQRVRSRRQGAARRVRDLRRRRRVLARHSRRRARRVRRGGQRGRGQPRRRVAVAQEEPGQIRLDGALRRARRLPRARKGRHHVRLGRRRRDLAPPDQGRRALRLARRIGHLRRHERAQGLPLHQAGRGRHGLRLRLARLFVRRLARRPPRVRWRRLLEHLLLRRRDRRAALEGGHQLRLGLLDAVLQGPALPGDHRRLARLPARRRGRGQGGASRHRAGAARDQGPSARRRRQRHRGRHRHQRRPRRRRRVLPRRRPPARARRLARLRPHPQRAVSEEHSRRRRALRRRRAARGLARRVLPHPRRHQEAHVNDAPRQADPARLLRGAHRQALRGRPLRGGPRPLRRQLSLRQAGLAPQRRHPHRGAPRARRSHPRLRRPRALQGRAGLPPRGRSTGPPAAAAAHPAPGHRAHLRGLFAPPGRWAPSLAHGPRCPPGRRPAARGRALP